MMGCTPDLPIELWTMIFFWASLRDRKTSKRIGQVCRQWRAIVAVSRQQCYKQESNSDGPYTLHRFLDDDLLSEDAEVLKGFKNFPRDPIFQEPAVFPPVIAVRGSIETVNVSVEQLSCSHDDVLTLGTVLEHLNKVFTRPWIQGWNPRQATVWLQIQEITPRKDLLGHLRVDIGYLFQSSPPDPVQAAVQIKMEREKEHCHNPSPKARRRKDFEWKVEALEKIRRRS